MIYLRSFLFSIVFIVTIIIWTPLLSVFKWFSDYWHYRFLRFWSVINLKTLDVICGVKLSVEGIENIPEQPTLVFSKHQSTYETIALQVIFGQQVWVLKKELLSLPFFGWALRTTSPIAIDRKAGRKAIDEIIRQGKERLSIGRWVIIFPEGTRVSAGKKGKYGNGGSLLAAATQCDVVPVAHNAGEFWPRRKFLKHPGVVRFVIGPPIKTTNMKAKQITEAAENWIEAKMDEITDPKFKADISAP